MHPVKRNIGQNIKRIVKGVWLNCTKKNLSVRSELQSYITKSYSNSLHQTKIARSACYHYHHFIQGESTEHAAGKGFAVDVFMQLKNEMVV